MINITDKVFSVLLKIFATHYMFLTLHDFLAHFPPLNITKEEFAKRFTVMYSTPQTLHDIFALKPPRAKSKTILKGTNDKRYILRDEIVEYFYEILIRNRYQYLEYFYEAYFEFKNPKTLKWNAPNLLSDKTTPEGNAIISVQKNDASRRIIRNLFYLELLHLTRVTNTVKSKVSFWESFVNMYNKLQLEDRFFAPSSIDLFLREKGTKREELSGVKEINYNNLFYLFQAYQPKASIFNPYAIKWIMENVLGNALGKSPTKIFTPVLSWGSYLVAFMHIPSYQHYVGVDVMPSVCKKVEFLGKWYQGQGAEFKKKRVDIICSPSERLGDDKSFLSTYKEYFDTMIVCPPYYDMEIYHEGEQSTETFRSYNDWLDGYWGETVNVCHKVCAKGGIFAVIANDYQSLDGKSFELTEDLNEITSAYFSHIGTFYLQNRTSPLRAAAKDRTERLFLYKKLF